MKNFIVPICLLLTALLIALAGWGSYALLERDSQRLLEPVEAIVQAVENEDWGAIDVEMEKLHQIWAGLEKYWPMLIHHAEMDRIEESLSKLKSYLRYQEEEESLAELYNLIHLIEHIPNKEAFTLQNIF